MKVGITGATGFIGRRLCKRLIEKGYDVTALVRDRQKLDDLGIPGIRHIVCDLTDTNSLKGALEGTDYLFHLGNVSRWWLADKKQYYEINVTGTLNILEEALRSKVKKVIYTSSVAAIRQSPGKLSTEELQHCGIFESRYGRSKYLAEQLVLDFCSKSGVHSVILNPGVVTGPGDVKTFGKMLIDFLNRNLKFRIFDNSYVPLVYIDDVVEAHIIAAEKGKCGEKYILVGENARIVDIFKAVSKMTGIPVPKHQMPSFIIKLMAYIYELKAMVDGSYPKLAVDAVRAMQLGASASNEKASREFSIKFMGMEKILANTIEWYINNGYVVK